MPEVRLPPAIDLGAAARLRDEIEAATMGAAGSPVVIAGTPGIFCDGLDLAPLATGEMAQEAVAAAVERFSQCIALLRGAAVPTIALVDGAARGGGLGLAAACDVVIATDRSRFALPELLWGMLPAVIYPCLRERMAIQQCRLWLLSGSARSAAEAWRAGLVDVVVPPSELERTGRAWERRLGRVRPDAIAKLRAFLGEDVTSQDAAALRGVALTTEALLEDRLRAALRRFHDTGEPPWETHPA